MPLSQPDPVSATTPETAPLIQGGISPRHPAADWDERLAACGGHLLQSWRWGEFKSRHGWTPERLSVETEHGSGMAQILFRARGPFSIGYVPRGPVLTGNAERLWPELRAMIDSAARRRRAITLILEPDTPLPLSGSWHDAGLVAGPAHFQPERTVIVPLLDDEPLLRQMHQKTRYSVRLAYRRGVEVRRMPPTEQTMATFYELMQDTSTRNDFGIHTHAYYRDFVHAFGDDAIVLGAWSDGHLAAALIAAAFGDRAIYMYGASSTLHRAHGAAFALQFEAMRWGRDRGCTAYDLWGIPAENPATTRADHADTIAGTRGSDWRGLYRFKTGFGGDIVSYPPTLERRYVPVLPWLARRAGVLHG